MRRAMLVVCVVLPAVATARPSRADDPAEGQLEGRGWLPVAAGISFKEGHPASTLQAPAGWTGQRWAGSGEEASTESSGSGSVESDMAWVEEPNESYRFVGLRGRYVVIPDFMFDLYQADGGSTVTAPGLGVEYAVRRNGFEYDAWLMYASYSMKASPFKAKSDPDQAYEIVESKLKTLTVGADFLWSIPMDKGFSFVYGGGAGLGVVFGDLYRNQAYPSQPGEYTKCPAPGQGPGDYCGTDNDHYGGYSEPGWFDGGSKPVIFPWIALPQLGLRWKPSPRFAMRLDTGLSFPGPFFFGLSGQYGLL